jgi:hypothetical protein
VDRTAVLRAVFLGSGESSERFSRSRIPYLARALERGL